MSFLKKDQCDWCEESYREPGVVSHPQQLLTKKFCHLTYFIRYIEMDPEDEYEYNITDINIHSFNNKADKGDDDFESWMMNEAPFGKQDYTINISDYTTDTVDIENVTTMGGSTITFGNDTTHSIDLKKFKALKYSMPIDILYKWFPQDMKDDEDDQIPF